MFYVQILRVQIPKVQKRQSSCHFFPLLGSELAKAAQIELVKLTLGGVLISFDEICFACCPGF